MPNNRCSGLAREAQDLSRGAKSCLEKSSLRRKLQNISAILEAAGSSLDKIASLTVVLASEDDFQGMNEEWLRWFPSLE